MLLKHNKGVSMLFKYIVFALFISASLFAKSNFGAIVTGSNAGTYKQLGNEISTVFQKYNATLEVIGTKGSNENIDALLGKNQYAKAKWAIIQNDALEYYNLIDSQKNKKDVTNLIKTVLPLYSEHIHLFIKKGNENNISFKKGSVIKVGVPSKTSDTNITANLLENAYGVTFDYRYVNFKTGIKYLQEGKIDVYIDVITLADETYKKLQEVSLLELPKNQLMDKQYIRAIFDKSSYPWLNKSIFGYKVPSVIVTNRVDKKYNQAIAIFIKIILNNYPELIKNGNSKWQEAYNNRTMKLENMHPAAYNILQR